MLVYALGSATCAAGAAAAAEGSPSWPFGTADSQKY